MRNDTRKAKRSFLATTPRIGCHHREQNRRQVRRHDEQEGGQHRGDVERGVRRRRHDHRDQHRQKVERHRHGKVQPVMSHRGPAQAPQHAPVGPGQDGLAGQAAAGWRPAPATAPCPPPSVAVIPSPELIVQDDRGGGQDQHLGERRTLCCAPVAVRRASGRWWPGRTPRSPRLAPRRPRIAPPGPECRSCSAKWLLTCGATTANPSPSTSEPRPQVSSAADTRPARLAAPGQLADEQGAEAEHADRAEQRHGRHRS